MSMGFPRFPRDLGGIMGNVPAIQAAPFWTLISANDAQFPDPFQPPPPATAYYPKFPGAVAAARSRKWATCDVVGLSEISAEFRTMSRATWMVFEMRKVDGWKSSDPCTSPEGGKLIVTECVNAQSAMRLLTRAKVPHVGLEPEAQPLRPRTLCNLQNTNRLIV